MFADIALTAAQWEIQKTAAAEKVVITRFYSMHISITRSNIQNFLHAKMIVKARFHPTVGILQVCRST